MMKVFLYDMKWTFLALFLVYTNTPRAAAEDKWVKSAPNAAFAIKEFNIELTTRFNKDVTPEGACTFNKYEPTSFSDDLTIEGVTTTKQGMEDELQKEARGAFVASIIVTALEVGAAASATFAAALNPFVGIGIALLGGLLAEHSDKNSFTPNDVLTKVDEALEKLTKRINAQMEEMKGYADRVGYQIQGEVKDDAYMGAYNEWTRCTNESRTPDALVQCEYDRFANLWDNRMTYYDNELWNKTKYYGKAPWQIDFGTVVQAEFENVRFRQFADLQFLQAVNLVFLMERAQRNSEGAQTPAMKTATKNKLQNIKDFLEGDGSDYVKYARMLKNIIWNHWNAATTFRSDYGANVAKFDIPCKVPGSMECDTTYRQDSKKDNDWLSPDDCQLLHYKCWCNKMGISESQKCTIDVWDDCKGPGTEASPFGGEFEGKYGVAKDEADIVNKVKEFSADKFFAMRKAYEKAGFAQVTRFFSREIQPSILSWEETKTQLIPRIDNLMATLGTKKKAKKAKKSKKKKASSKGKEQKQQ